MSVDDTVAAVLAAGRDLLARPERQVVGLGVRLKDAIEHAGVPLSTGYRLFQSDTSEPQAVFTARLVRSLIERGDHTNPDRTLSAVEAVINEHQDVFDHGSSTELAVVLREAIRQGANANVAALAENISFRAYMIALAVAPTETEDDPDRLGAALAAAELQKSTYVDAYERLSALFGLRLRPTATWQQLDAVISSTAHGTALRSRYNPHVVDIMRPTGEGGELQRWNAVGITVEQLLLAFCEPNPRIKNPADTGSWLLPHS